MFRLLCSMLMLALAGLCVVFASHSVLPSRPLINKGDYGAVISYLQKYIPEQISQHDISGLSIALVNDQELIWVRGFGYADKAMGVPISANTAFRADALSQLISATAVLQLVDQRRLSLDQPVQAVLPEFSVRSRFHTRRSDADQNITVRRLLSHQSGLPSEHLRGLHGSFPISAMPMRLSGVWLSTMPGTQIPYSNVGYELLGAAIERVTGLGFEWQLQRSVLIPLGMGQSSFIGDNTRLSFRAQGYRNGVHRTDRQVRDVPARGLWTTPRDLSHYVRMLFAQGRYKDQRVLSKAAIDEMFTAQNEEDALVFDCRVGLAWNLSACGEQPISAGVRAYHRSVASDAFSAQLSLLPDQQLAVIIMSNEGKALPVVKGLALDALRMMLRAQSGEGGETHAAPKQLDGQSRWVLSERACESLTGAYATATGVFRIKEDDGQLYGELSGKQFQLLPDENGWLHVQKQIFASRQAVLGAWGRLPLNVLCVHGRRRLVAERHQQHIVIGERIDPELLPDGWSRAIGTYDVLNPDDLNEQASGMSVRFEEGVLVMRGKLHTEEWIDYVLIPVDDVHALLAGSGPQSGDTVTRIVSGLSYSGFRFKRSVGRLFSWSF